MLSASVMSAPAALAMSKLFYPETKKSKTTSKDVAEMGESEEALDIGPIISPNQLEIELLIDMSR